MFTNAMWRQSFNKFVRIINKPNAKSAPILKLAATLSTSLLLYSQTSSPATADHHLWDNGSQHLTKNFVADAVAIASPSVVNIRSSMGNSMFGHMESSGSGFIISEDGFVATNAHVVEKSTGNVLVTLWNGQKKRGVVHSYDTVTDIALVKIDTSDIPKLTATGGSLSEDQSEALPVARLGQSSQLRAGEFVVALGSPLLLSNSVTFGIVSSTARLGSELGMNQNRTEFIQTDAAINMGNSGGPLVNINGEVIGINTMKIQFSSGISFAIPIDTAKLVIAQLKANKKVQRPYIGMRIANYYNPVTDKDAKAEGGKESAKSKGPARYRPSVVMIMDVEPNSPCAEAGLGRGDIIIEIEGDKVGDVKDVLEHIGVEVDQQIKLTVQKKKDGRTLSTTIKTVAKKEKA